MIKFLKFGGGGEETGVALGKGFVPVNRVKELSGKGFSEPEMIDVLRREGYSAEEIDRAFSMIANVAARKNARHWNCFKCRMDLNT